MDLFRRLIKHFFSIVPFNVFLVVVVVFTLVFFALESCVNAADLSTITYNDTTYTFFIPDNAWGVFQQLPEYTSGSYNYLLYCNSGYCYIYFWDATETQQFYNNIDSDWRNYNKFNHSNDNISCHYYRIYENGTTIPTEYETKLSSQMGTSSYANNSTRKAYMYTNLPIFTDNTYTTRFWDGLTPPFVEPFIVTSSSDIESWRYSDLVINIGSIPITDTIGNSTNFTLTTTYESDMNKFDFDISCEPYLDSETKLITIPRHLILNNFIIEDFSINFELFIRGYGIINSYDLGDYTITLTTAQVNEINGQNALDREEENNQRLVNSIEESNNYLNELSSTDIDNSLITDYFNIDDGGGTATDSTGIESFFMILYNAFCTNEPINVTFTLPFVNKNVVISSAEISSHYPQSLKSLVSVIAWGGIALFICKDIRKMIDKMQEGNVENVSRNVEREVL